MDARIVNFTAAYETMQWVSLSFYLLLVIAAIRYYLRSRSDFRMFVAGTILSWAMVNITFYVLVITSRPVLPEDFATTFSAVTKIQGVILLLVTLWRLDKER